MQERKIATWEEIAGKPVYPKVDDVTIFLRENMPEMDGNNYILSDAEGQKWCLWYTQIKPIATAMESMDRVKVLFKQDPNNERYVKTTIMGEG
jgi:hypothetical protein